MQVFISCSSKEYDKTNALRQVLEANGITCWMTCNINPNAKEKYMTSPEMIMPNNE